MGLQITGKEVIAGIPALTARKLAANAADGFYDNGDAAFVQRVLRVDEVLAKRILEAFISSGFIERSRKQDSPERGILYELTDAGFKLAAARGSKRLKRNTVEKTLSDILNRAEEINNGRHPFIFRIKTLIVFGSYLRNEKLLGDLDLALELEYLERDENKQRDAYQGRIATIAAEGRRFRNFLDRAGWPRTEVEKYLIGPNRGVSIQHISDFANMKKDSNFAYKALIGDLKEIEDRLRAANKT